LFKVIFNKNHTTLAGWNSIVVFIQSVTGADIEGAAASGELPHSLFGRRPITVFTCPVFIIRFDALIPRLK